MSYIATKYPEKQTVRFGLLLQVAGGPLIVRVNKEHVLELKPELPTTSFLYLFLLSQKALLDLRGKILTQLFLDFYGSRTSSLDQGLDCSNQCFLPCAFLGH